ncbi:hypothetical protein GCM10011514_32620 [Emticicia aquatilis]|uniref:Uncharacterized protein n=1 Tax=Emticicia aquatilis TaxID=1537369 RepID=A0A916YYN1_9BACT|nr:hypothetical protein [Emticicia aquatilis]GGD66063.1 hypothetical protein GCM10011514_32620 [Emticicia aquatilis]
MYWQINANTSKIITIIFIAKVNLKTPQSVQLYLSDIKGNTIKEYSFVGVEGMNNFEINIQYKVTIESIYNIRCQAGI